MDNLYHQLNSLQCLSITDYLKHKMNLNNKSNSSSIIITTPELMEALRRLSYKFGIIKTSNYFIDHNHVFKKDRLNLNFANLVSQGHCLLKQLHDQCSILNITKMIEKNNIQSEIYKIYEKFIDFENHLKSFYEIACQQIEMINNQLNVTNQLIGYKNNLNCIGSTKYTQVYQPDLSQEKRPRIAPRFNIPNYDQITCDPLDQLNKSCETKHNEVQWPPTIQEQAGICIKYPGESETHSAYTKPNHCVSEVLTNHGQLRVCKPGYQINPHSEIKLEGYGPIKQYELNKIEQSEYIQTYTWPDGKKIHTNPWNRSRGANHFYGIK
ncbi:unnamed protein product [Schistosoma rodhaini]|uniref:Uncharacterized protein n=2 Tax=Schistosoma rodhaini TaxID=6188 RepID=A0AA85GBD9_9TREM|nr:unnamed protein product [Schistosoma rodhaini]